MFELAALGAALCWAVTGLVGAGPARAVGPTAFGFYRQGMVTLMLGAVTLVTGGWQSVTGHDAAWLALSGLVGVFLGDTLLFFSLVRLGPRRAGALFALNAPMAALLGRVVLGETLPPQGWAGVALCAVGVAVAVLGRPGRSGTHSFEAVRGRVWIGVTFGLLAALGQAGGSLIARPVMAAGQVDAMTASLIRVGIAVVCSSILVSLPIRQFRPQARLTLRLGAQIAASGVLAMLIGMTLLLFALSGGKVGIVSTLSALSPVLILPVLWIVTGARPSATSWAGAAMATVGMALIFLR
ncbi:DMT family transporter [Paracoccus suum]|uniref:DMT family transporter n=1 Tax=Paracoccus suum TaxID=2259340 RepID=A0A344PKI9_9RHOB|nr:DMT family transporter [Paracoccus suum]AXC49894.1 DMT family transporter [Paracoccus suum]